MGTDTGPALRAAAGATAWCLAALAVVPLVGETPPTALAQALVEATPGPLATAVIESLGPLAQPLAVAGACVLLVALGVALALALSRTGALADVRTGVAGPVRFPVAVVLLTLGAFLAVSPDLAGVAAALAVAAAPLLVSGALSTTAGPGRRAFLRRGGLAGLALAGLGTTALGARELVGTAGEAGRTLDAAAEAEREKATTGRTLTGEARAAGTATATASVAGSSSSSGSDSDSDSDSGSDDLTGGMATAAEQPVVTSTLDSGEPFGFDFRGMPAELTPVEEHYVVDKEVVDPDIDASDWTLDVGGRVASGFELDLGDLVGHPEARKQVVTTVCVSNPVGGPLVSTTQWRGVPLRVLLEEADPVPETYDIVSQAYDGYTESIPWEVVRERGDILVAFGMNGRTLPTANGFPARLVIPGRYGMKQTKWLTGVGAVESDYKGYWQARRWDEQAVVNTLSYVRAAQRRGDRLAVGGIAYAGVRGIERVEVSLDGGFSWREATLEEPLSPYARRRWRLVTEVPPDRREVVVRATDGTGRVQTETESSPHPDGATGWHRVEVDL